MKIIFSPHTLLNEQTQKEWELMPNTYFPQKILDFQEIIQEIIETKSPAVIIYHNPDDISLQAISSSNTKIIVVADHPPNPSWEWIPSNTSFQYKKERVQYIVQQFRQYYQKQRLIDYILEEEIWLPKFIWWGLIHEQSNSLQVALGFSQEILTDSTLSSSLTEDIQFVERSIHKACALINDIRAVNSPKEYNLHELIRIINVTLAYPLRKRQAKIELEYPEANNESVIKISPRSTCFLLTVLYFVTTILEKKSKLVIHKAHVVNKRLALHIRFPKNQYIENVFSLLHVLQSNDYTFQVDQQSDECDVTIEIITG